MISQRLKNVLQILLLFPFIYKCHKFDEKQGGMLEKVWK